MLLLALGASLILMAALLPLVTRYSTAIFLSPTFKRLNLSPAEGAAQLANHTFLLIGGPHRGGTTLIWRLLAQHPACSGFAETHTDTDFAEGSFLQTVLPTFGVGTELTMGGRGARSAGIDGQKSGGSGSTNLGLGRYAFAPSSHMTEHHMLNTNASSLKLLSEWGYHWNLSKPILLEKTPTNMMTSRLLQALLTPRATTFLFITRHPIAVSLAHKRWACCGRMTISSLLLHWVVSHRVLASDLPRLRDSRVLRYEDLVRRPASCMRKLFRWLHLPDSGLGSESGGEIGDASDSGGNGGSNGGNGGSSGRNGGSSSSSSSSSSGNSRSSGGATASVASDTNQKYERMYCEKELATPAQKRAHCAAGLALQPAIERFRLGYDVLRGSDVSNGFGCLSRALGRGKVDVCAGVPPETALLEGLRAHERAVELGASDPWALVSAPGGRVGMTGGARQLCET